MSLSEKFYKGYGHGPVHLLNKCETCNKNRRESNAVTKLREALSFSAFLVIFFAFAKSDIIATAIVILKLCGFSGILFALKLAKRIPLGASRISLRSNITRHRRIELAWYSDKSITPNGHLFFWRCYVLKKWIMISLKLVLHSSAWDDGDDIALAGSDIVGYSSQWYSIRPKTREANTTRRKPNITA